MPAAACNGPPPVLDYPDRLPALTGTLRALATPVRKIGIGTARLAEQRPTRKKGLP
jgi:hypothetical protein